MLPFNFLGFVSSHEFSQNKRHAKNNGTHTTFNPNVDQIINPNVPRHPGTGGCTDCTTRCSSINKFVARKNSTHHSYSLLAGGFNKFSLLYPHLCDGSESSSSMESNSLSSTSSLQLSQGSSCAPSPLVLAADTLRVNPANDQVCLGRIAHSKQRVHPHPALGESGVRLCCGFGGNQWLRGETSTNKNKKSKCCICLRALSARFHKTHSH